MTHGDAIMIIKRRTDTIEQRLEAINLIFFGDSKNYFNSLSKHDIWETVKFLYKEVIDGKS